MIANLTYFAKLLKTNPIDSNLNELQKLAKRDV
ncbi:MAG: hypothetical protein JWR09_5624 [Mucilaginibacter sp.]|nr:hypothetical protein [Mucilaginibacter sp.]